jgi:hypothetical protein
MVRSQDSVKVRGMGITRKMPIPTNKLKNQKVMFLYDVAMGQV